MGKLSDILQGCVGASFILLSFGAMWGMISGSVVRGRIAGANFSVNEKLEAVETARERVEDATIKLKSIRAVPRAKIKRIERDLEAAETVNDQTQQNISEDLTEMLEDEDLN